MSQNREVAMTNEPASNLAWLSRAMAWLATAGLVLTPAVLVFAYLSPPSARALMFDIDGLGDALSANVPLPYRLAAMVLSLGAEGFTLWALWSLRVLFLTYAAGDVFSPRALQLLNNVAAALFAGVVVTFVIHAPITAVLSWPLGPGHRYISLNFGTGEVITLFEAGVVLVIARVMNEARRLADENAKFV
jgi:Protein of unknown function (DUF2975)